jgi:hypothetical protein
VSVTPIEYSRLVLARMIENNDFYRLLKVAEGYTEMLKVYKKEFSAVLLVAKASPLRYPVYRLMF